MIRGSRFLTSHRPQVIRESTGEWFIRLMKPDGFVSLTAIMKPHMKYLQKKAGKCGPALCPGRRVARKPRCSGFLVSDWWKKLVFIFLKKQKPNSQNYETNVKHFQELYFFLAINMPVYILFSWPHQRRTVIFFPWPLWQISSSSLASGKMG